MELRELAGSTWVIPGPVNIGAYVMDGAAAMIDSGGDESSGRKVMKLTGAKGWEIAAIINTHSNADHIGGNALIQKRTGCRIIASRLESHLIETPALEPFFLWAGDAPRELRNKFFQAQPSHVTDIVEPGDPVPGFPLSTIDLKGHMPGMIGVMTDDGVAFLGDCVVSEAILEKYGIPYISDLASEFETLDKLAAMEADWFVPSHAEPCRDIRPLASANRRTLEKLRDEALAACAEPRTRDDLVGHLASLHNADMNPVQYVLIHGTVSAIVSWLLNEGAIRPEPIDGKMAWLRV